jgi:hypothetical protein
VDQRVVPRNAIVYRLITRPRFSGAAVISSSELLDASRTVKAKPAA